MRILLLPGMGADASMYGAAFRAIPGIELLDWPPYAGEKSIRDVALRMIREHTVSPRDIVGGSSLGGMVAAEIARSVEVEALILIGSAPTVRNVHPILRRAGPFATATPFGIITFLSTILGEPTGSALLRMFGESEGKFIKAMCRAIPRWEGNPRPPRETLWIHGAKDRIIRPPARGARLIADGGHLIAMTHPRIVADFIRNHFQNRTASRTENA